MMKLDRKRAELELERAGKLNPGKWTDHSRYTAQACENIAARCDGMSPDTAYCYGLLHDIGRYAGVTSEKHRSTATGSVWSVDGRKRHRSVSPLHL